jgi:uncharacterized protein
VESFTYDKKIASANRRFYEGLPQINTGGFKMPYSREELNAILYDLAKSYAARAVDTLGDQIESIALYGSVARGQAGPGSDIDLFVVLRDGSPGMLVRRRLLDPVRESLTPELEALWRQGIYADFIEVIRTRAEARQFHPLYLDMSQEAILLYDRDHFLETLLVKVGEHLKRGGAERKVMGRFSYWDLLRSSIPVEVSEQ